jgi:DNA polymerase III subunit delta'
MGFSDFHGNSETITRLRELIAHKRFPHAVILAGPRGAGKYTLAQMLAKVMNCTAPPPGKLPDFCGECANCTRIAAADDLEARFAEAVEAREAMRESDKRETRILIQTHPDVIVIPPDPPQMRIKVDQVRRVTATIFYRPAEARERVYIFTDSAFMREAANALLKVLEEPPEFATLFLLTENPGELLPTIRSRSISFLLAPLPAEEIEGLLAREQREWTPKQRALVARLSEGAVGRALAFDLAAYVEARDEALILLRTAAAGGEHTDVFKTTDSFRSGSEGRERTERLLRTLHSLLEDMLFLQSGTPELVRNTDIAGELKRLASGVDFAWITRAAQAVGEVEYGMRRNLLRSLSLDAMVLSLEPAART